MVPYFNKLFGDIVNDPGSQNGFFVPIFEKGRCKSEIQFE